MSIFSGSRFSLMIYMLATFILMGVKVYADSVVVSCKVTRVLVNGRDIGIPNMYPWVFVFDEDKKTMRYKSQNDNSSLTSGLFDCSNVSIEADSVSGTCGRTRFEIDRTNGQIHQTFQQEGGCVHGHYNHGYYNCDEYSRDNVENYYQCQKQEVKPKKNDKVVF